MVHRYFEQNGIRVISVVHNNEEAAIMRKELGENIRILNSSMDNFELEVRSLTNFMNTTAVLDTLGGDLPVRILKCMPKRSTLYLISSLSIKPATDIVLEDLAIDEKLVKGVSLIDLLYDTGMFTKVKYLWQVKKHLKDTLRCPIADIYNFDDFVGGILAAKDYGHIGKVVFKPHAPRRVQMQPPTITPADALLGQRDLSKETVITPEAHPTFPPRRVI
jgi:NADPH:quinone reductase-like Zn-dependent oxidoreductase